MRFILQENVFNSNCTFHLNVPLEQTRKLVTSLCDEDIDWEYLKNQNGFCITVKLKDGTTGHLIYMENFSPDIESISILSHEIIHLVTHIIDHKGVPFRVENDEVFAYLHECYLRQALKRVLPKKKSKKSP